MNTPCSSSSSNFSVPTAETGEIGQEMAEFFAKTSTGWTEWDNVCLHYEQQVVAEREMLMNMTIDEMNADVDRMF
jgi:hypothetical protein